jgi:hypothetical protein
MANKLSQKDFDALKKIVEEQGKKIEELTPTDFNKLAAEAGFTDVEYPPTPEPTPEPTPTPTPEPTPEPQPSGNILYSSNDNGKWNDGNARTVKDKEGDQSPNGKGLYTAASGNPELVIDGNGIAHLLSSKYGRIYILACNYNAQLEVEFAIENANVDDLSLKMRSQHQERPSGRQDAQSMADVQGDAFGGYGGSVSLTKWDSKREPEHNFHDTSKGGNLPKPLKIGQWAKAKLAVKDEGQKVHWTLDLDYLDGNGYQKLMDRFDDNPLPFMVDKSRYEKKSYFWIRNNSTKGGQGSIALRNVKLTTL